jgi:predicted nucleic acid-binding protein
VIYLLDTNAWIAYLRQNNTRLVQRFLSVDPAEIALCSVVPAHDLTVVSHNTGAFSRVPSLKLEDWQ